MRIRPKDGQKLRLWESARANGDCYVADFWEGEIVYGQHMKVIFENVLKSNKFKI